MELNRREWKLASTINDVQGQNDTFLRKGVLRNDALQQKDHRKKQSFKTDPGLGMLLRVDLQLVYVRHSDPQHSKHHNFVTQHRGYLGVMRLMNRAKYE